VQLKRVAFVQKGASFFSGVINSKSKKMASSSDTKLNPYMTVSVSRDDFFKTVPFTLRDGTILYGSIARSEKLDKGSFVLLHGKATYLKFTPNMISALISIIS
jgi:hypothetical protein